VIIPRTSTADTTSIAAHYDDLDPFYRAVWGSHVHHGYWVTGNESPDQAVLNLTELVADHADIRKGTRVCDVGCGYGASARIFNQQYGAKVTGITISKKQYDFAAALCEGVIDLDFRLCDALHNDLPTGSFDSVVAIESMEHIADKPRFFAETNRLLDRDGRFVIAAWLAPEQLARWKVRYLLEPICFEGRLPNLLSASEYRTMLMQAGFSDVTSLDLTSHVSKTWTICVLRSLTRIGSDSSLRRRLFDSDFSNRVFLRTVFRIWLAYKTGSMRYGLFSARKRAQ
jgi:tocopherol O-methyltransferase